VESGGLTGGLTAWHLRLLCDNPWNGGGGYSPREVAEWSLDQVWFRLCELETLKHEVGGRAERMETAAAMGVLRPAEDGTVMGRAADGTPIRGRVRGKSLARELMEREVAERKRKRKKMERCHGA